MGHAIKLYARYNFARHVVQQQLVQIVNHYILLIIINVFLVVYHRMLNVRDVKMIIHVKYVLVVTC